ncbi:hypothetical protein [Xanthomonas campestris]|uniref:hypothetical protein n=1 Tax=Xanthomonas campestris TaxID=339 RepID=UPI0023E9C5AA|nr:hypothetical protein [Xanthomonas campestris]
MDSIGVYFRIDRQDLYVPFVEIFQELKQSKDTEDFGDPSDWKEKLHPEVASRLFTLSDEERASDHHLRSTRPIVITSPQDAIGSAWDFGAILDAVKMGDYQLRDLEKVDDHTAELRIDPHGYPYGGIGAFIALTEAHGMHVLGTNEYGKYEPRDVVELMQGLSAKKWWQFWR